MQASFIMGRQHYFDVIFKMIYRLQMQNPQLITIIKNSIMDEISFAESQIEQYILWKQYHLSFVYSKLIKNYFLIHNDRTLFVTTYFSCCNHNSLFEKVITYHNSFVEHKAQHLRNTKTRLWTRIKHEK